MLDDHRFALLVITLYSVVGLMVYQDYGISWDEEFQHHYGKVVYAHVFADGQELLEHRSRYHGPVFQSGLFAAERIFGLKDPKRVFEMRHLLTFIFSVIGCWFFYRLLLLLRFKPYWATIGLLFLICSPRIFAHSFYNAKDAVFMYGFIIGIYTMLRFLRRPNWRTALWHGLVCGLLIDVRILGVFVPLLTGILWLAQVARAQKFKRSDLLIGVFGTISLLTVFTFWPTLWHSPLTEMQNALGKMSAYPWDDPVLFEGSFIIPQDLPWYYLPKWMLISTPIFICAMTVVGLCRWFFNYRLTISEKFIPLLWVLLPFALILWKDATVYDGWRHVFFLYPALLILAVAGAETLFDSWAAHRWFKRIPLALLMFPLFFIVKEHPHQQVYFNPLVMRDAWQNYEMDYWGLSYKQALESLTEDRSEDTLILAVANAPGFYNHWMLAADQRGRIHYSRVDSADYFISNFRFPSEHYAFAKGTGSYADPVRIIEVGGNPIVGVFRLKDR